jgi:hypothetical protein
MSPRLRRLAILLASVLAIGGCNPTTSPNPSSASPRPSPSASAAPTSSPTEEPSASVDVAALYAAIQEEVAELRELEPRADVDPQILDEEELKRRTEESFRRDNPEAIVEANERLYKALGLLDEDASLTDLYLELLGSQVAGFYDPDAKELYVVSRSGRIGVVERVTFAHEYTHALQDQHFDLSAFGFDDLSQSDRNLARLSLIEGDATALMSFWAQQNLTPSETLELLGSSLNPEQLEILNRMPAILREPLEFPYSRGLQLVLQLQATGGWDAVDAAYERPPDSTEQILHPEKYTAREVPVEVDLPADLAADLGEGWSVAIEDSFGEFQLGVWLRTVLRRVVPANDAAAGWGGDRLAVLNGPEDAWAVAIITEWDSAAEASEFADAAGEALTLLERPSALTAQNGSTRVTVMVASEDAVITRLDVVLGATGA